MMDYYGYKLAPSYYELTPEQAVFINLGRIELDKKINGENNKELSRVRRH